MTTIIACADCGSTHEARAKNTKYCKVCRLYRNLMFQANTGQPFGTCKLCDNTFTKLNRNDILCGKCVFMDNASGSCSICDREAPLYHADVRLCLPCLKNPALYRKVVAALKRKRDTRTQEDNSHDNQEQAGIREGSSGS